MFRLQRYKATERQANERFNENCRLRNPGQEAGG
jgi:hypothetical protein